MRNLFQSSGKKPGCRKEVVATGNSNSKRWFKLWTGRKLGRQHVCMQMRNAMVMRTETNGTFNLFFNCKIIIFLSPLMIRDVQYGWREMPVEHERFASLQISGDAKERFCLSFFFLIALVISSSPFSSSRQAFFGNREQQRPALFYLSYLFQIKNKMHAAIHNRGFEICLCCY